MATTDSNGIVFLEETDPISPFHTTINTLQQGTSDAIGSFGSGSEGSFVIHYVADTTARSALATTYGPTASKPLYVHRGNAATGLELEVTENGTTWYTHAIALGSGPVVAQFSPGKINTGVTLTTLSIPSLPVATTCVIRVNGQGGFDTVDRQCGFDITTSAGTLTQPAGTVVHAPNGKWTTLYAGGTLTLSANTSATVTIKSNADGQSYYRGMAVVERYRS